MITKPFPNCVPTEESVLQSADAWVERSGILSNRYFSALRSDGMTRETFTASQMQFYFAVRYFSRPMAALMARMADSASRQGLIHNLSEEHGFCDEGDTANFDPELAHDRTFCAFLQTLGVKSVASLREGTGVKAFNVGLMGACMMEPIETAFSCLGVIEYAFADISQLIGRKVVERGWIAHGELVHYKLHAEIDKRHAADFFTMVSRAWESGGEMKARVEDGLALGTHLFNRLYEDLAEL